MIEIILSKSEYIKFTAEARKRMRIKGWGMDEVAAHIHRPVGSVRNFFSRKSKPSRYLAAEIADALGMEFRNWR